MNKPALIGLLIFTLSQLELGFEHETTKTDATNNGKILKSRTDTPSTTGTTTNTSTFKFKIAKHAGFTIRLDRKQ